MSRYRRRCRSGRLLTVAAVVGAVGIAGCGSSSSKPKLSKDQFLTQANAICKAGNDKTNAEAAKLGNSPTEAQAVKLITTSFVPEIQTEITSIRALSVQTADKNKLASMLDLAEGDLNKVKANPTLLIGTSGRPFRDFAAQAHPYGLTECAPND